MFYKEILEQLGPGSAFLEHLETQILKNFPLGANHGDAFVSSMYVLVCWKKLWMHLWYVNICSKPNQLWNKNKEYKFSLVFDIAFEKSCLFNVEWNIYFFSISWTHFLKLIKQLLCRVVKFNRFLISLLLHPNNFFFSTHFKGTLFDV